MSLLLPADPLLAEQLAYYRAVASGTCYWGAGARHARAALERPSQPEEHRSR